MIKITPTNIDSYISTISSTIIILTVFVAILSYLNQHLQDKKSRWVESSIEDNRVKTALAIAEAAEAKRATALANERAAEFEKETAELKLTLEREINARKPRYISSKQRSALLSNFPLSRDERSEYCFFIDALPQDVEAHEYSMQIKSVLEEAGFQTLPATKGLYYREQFNPRLSFGIHFVVSENCPIPYKSIADKMRIAFDKSGIQVTITIDKQCLRYGMSIVVNGKI